MDRNRIETFLSFSLPLELAESPSREGISMRARKKVTKDLPLAIMNEIRKWEKAKRVPVLSNANARNAVERLYWAGCAPVTILQLLSNYCGIGLHTEAVRRNMKRVLKRVQSLSRRLLQDATEVRAVDKFLGLGLDFPADMEDLADYLKPEGLYAEEVRCTILARGSGLQSELVDAIAVAKMVTGKAHDHEMADLVQAISGRTTNEDDLRKTVANFRDTLFHSPRSQRQIQALVERRISKRSRQVRH